MLDELSGCSSVNKNKALSGCYVMCDVQAPTAALRDEASSCFQLTIMSILDTGTANASERGRSAQSSIVWHGMEAQYGGQINRAVHAQRTHTHVSS